MMVEEILRPTRELIDGVYYCIHVSRDGQARINTGPDDQRPDHDGLVFFRPICVAQYLGSEPDAGLYTYVKYCGKCRKRIGSLGEVKQYCPRCGAGIAHYIFAMGLWEWRAPWRTELPDQLPEFPEGCGFVLSSAEKKRLSGGIANDQTSNGKCLDNGGE